MQKVIGAVRAAPAEAFGTFVGIFALPAFGKGPTMSARASETSKTIGGIVYTVATMNLRPCSIELVVADMATTLTFYRRLGLDIPSQSDGAPHVDASFGGIRIAFDTEDTIRSFDPAWSAPASGGHRVALAFDCGTPDQVDAAWVEIVGNGYHGHLAPWDAFWGMRYAVVHDPDGTPVDLFAHLPHAEVS